MALATPATAPGADTSNSLLEAKNVSVQFGRQRVLRDVSLSVSHGETVAVIGESGCGKTVLLKSLIGLVVPESGSVEFEQKRLDKLGDRGITKLRTRYGFVFQNAALFDSMTIADNVAFPLMEHGRERRESAYKIVREQLKEVGLPASVMAKKPAELSGGMRKRVGLARALVMNPDVILYDEPTTGLDPIMSDVINELILRTRKHHNVASVVVTHDMHSALKLADRIVMLYPLARLGPDEPQVIFEGTPDEIQRSRDKRVSQFVRGEAGDRISELGEK